MLQGPAAEVLPSVGIVLQGPAAEVLPSVGKFIKLLPNSYNKVNKPRSPLPYSLLRKLEHLLFSLSIVRYSMAFG